MNNKEQKRGCSKTVFLLLLLFFSCSISAKAIQQISVDEGLLGVSIWGIQHDEAGFVWVASSAGVYRYDGYQIKSFGQAHPLSNAYVTSLIKHSDGNLWLSTIERGVWKIEPDTSEATLVVPYQEQEPYEYMSPDILFWLSDEVLLMGLNRHVLSYDVRTEEIKVLFELPEDAMDGHLIRSFLVLNQQLLIGTSAGLFGLDLASQKSYQIMHNAGQVSSDNTNVKLFHQDGEYLWVGTVAGVYRYPLNFLDGHSTEQNHQQAAELYLPEVNVWDIHQADDQLYLATSKGLYSHQPNAASKYIINFSDSPYYTSNNNMTKVHQDASGFFWLGSISDGLFVWNPESVKFKNFSVDHGLASNVVWSFAEDDKQRLLVGTENGLSEVDWSTNTAANYLNNEFDDTVQNIVEDLLVHPNGKVYLFSTRGIRVFDSESKVVSPLANKEQSFYGEYYAWAPVLDPENNIWWLTEEGVVSFDSETQSLRPITWVNEKSELAWDCYMFSGPEKKLFLSCPDALLLIDVINKEVTQVTDYGAIKRFNEAVGLAADSFVEDEQGRWWFSLGANGVIVLDGENQTLLKQFTPGYELPNSEYFTLLHDEKNHSIWVASGVGLFQINERNFAIQRYTAHEGTHTNDFSYADGLILHDGRMVYGGSKGLVLFDGKDFDANKQSNLTVALSGSSSFAHASEGLTLKNQSKFAYTDTSLSFEFTAFLYKKNKNVLFRYELVGPESIVYPPSTNNTITFPRLAPGNYTLKATAVETLSGYESEPATVSFAVAYAWWNNPWAKAAYVLVAMLIAWLWLNSRRKQHLVLAQAHQNALRSERKLSLALQSSNSHVWEWSAADNSIEQARIYSILGHQSEHFSSPLETHIDLIHPEDKPLFIKAWRRFLGMQDSQFKLVYRMQNHDGQWLWFSDIATGQLKAGRIIRATGTYTNITEQYAQEHNAALYGEIFQQAYDAVLIVNNDWQVETANQAFLEKLKVQLVSISGMEVKQLFAAAGTQIEHRKVSTELQQKGYFRTEAVLCIGEEETPVLISCSEVKGIFDEQKFLFTLTSIKALKEAEQALLKLAKFDQLTELPNRTMLLEELNQICHTENEQQETALMFIDLDRFKQVNDSLGHTRGDQLLVKVGKRIQQNLNQGDLLARFGGDEFVVLIQAQNKTKEALSDHAQQIIQAISKPVELGLATVVVSPSIGVALYPEDAQSAEDLLQAADVAMYHAKAKGRGEYEFYTEQMKSRAQDKLQQEYLIKQAHDNNQFVNFYQPIIDVENETISGLEILLRWRRDGALSLPHVFIDQAEEIGLLGAMTLKALETGLNDLSGWHQTHPDLCININISAKHFEDIGFVKDIQRVMNRSKIPANQVNLELTESTLLQNKQQAVEAFDQLRLSGHQLYLDDFGTGYSSLSYIHELAMDGVKIDKSFVKDLGNQAKTKDKTQAITQGIIQMCVGLGFTLVAEGVETKEQYQELLSMGARFQQGFLFAEPATAEEIKDVLQQQDQLIPRH